MCIFIGLLILPLFALLHLTSILLNSLDADIPGTIGSSLYFKFNVTLHAIECI